MLSWARLMKITSVRSFLLSYPLPEPVRLPFHGGERTILKRDAMFIRVEADSGLIGYAPGPGSEQAHQAIQEQVRETVREESLSAYAKFGEGVEAAVETRFQAVHEESKRNGRQIMELGARLDTHEHNLLDLVIALGRNCLQSAERMTPAKAPANGGGGSGSETHVAAADVYEVPSFARQGAPKRHWRIPAVSCFLMATTGLLALHILVV